MGGHSDGTARHGYRFRTAIQAEVRVDGRPMACEVQNLSRSGALLAGDIPEPTSKNVELTLKSPLGHLSVRVSGQVIRSGPSPEGPGTRLAIEFVDMDEARRDGIEALLSRLLEAHTDTPLDSLKPGAPPQEVRKALEAIPVAQRIAMAARAAARERDVLRMDTNPAILESLVRNPGLSLQEARALATSAYLIPGTLDALAHDPRFQADEELRLAIVSHSKVSQATAERIIAGLKLPQVRALLAKPGLSPLVRDRLFRRTTRG